VDLRKNRSREGVALYEILHQNRGSVMGNEILEEVMEGSTRSNKPQVAIKNKAPHKIRVPQ
jgi:hypothetical protein